MSVRLASAADLERLVELNLEVHDLHVAHMPDLFKPADPEDVSAYFAAMVAADAAEIFVACEGPVVVGYLLLVLRERPEDPVMLAQRFAYIEQIGVTAEHRGRGHGHELIAAARTFARQRGLDRVELDTWGFNKAAHAFFHAEGFHTRNIRMATGT